MVPRWSGRKRIMTIMMVTALSCEDNRLAVHGVADGRDEAEDPAVRGEGRRGGETVGPGPPRGRVPGMLPEPPVKLQRAQQEERPGQVPGRRRRGTWAGRGSLRRQDLAERQQPRPHRAPFPAGLRLTLSPPGA